MKELLAVKNRSGRRQGLIPSSHDLQRLKDALSRQTHARELFVSLLPARIVTVIEVFCRYWIQKLIDHGSPFQDRAVGLKGDIKYDFALARSLHGQNISLGLLLSHSVSLSTVDAIDATFSILLNGNFFNWISRVQDRFDLEEHGESAKPIISDSVELRRSLTRLFEIRHVLVHEFPEKPTFGEDEIDSLFDAACQFVDAADEGLTRLIYGLYPTNQNDMNERAREESEAATEELAELVKKVAAKSNSSAIIKVQKQWESFCSAEASRIAQPWVGGSMMPLIYHTAIKSLTRDRTIQLQAWLDEEYEGE